MVPALPFRPQGGVGLGLTGSATLLVTSPGGHIHDRYGHSRAHPERRTSFDSLQDPCLVGRGAFGHRYATVRDGGEYRPEWTWVALRDGVVVARAAWWGGPEDTEPVLFNYFDFAPGEDAAGAELLRRAPWSVEYELIVPAGWRELPEVRAAAAARVAAAEAAGLELLVERYRYEWTPADGLPERPGRLVFRPEPDDEVILEVLRRVHSVTLDAHARRAVEGAVWSRPPGRSSTFSAGAPRRAPGGSWRTPRTAPSPGSTCPPGIRAGRASASSGSSRRPVVTATATTC